MAPSESTHFNTARPHVGNPATNFGPDEYLDPNTTTHSTESYDVACISDFVSETLRKHQVSLVDCATAANSDPDSRLAVMRSLQKMSNQRYEVIFPEHSALKPKDDDDGDREVLQEIQKAKHWSEICGIQIQAGGLSQLQKGLDKNRQLCGKQITEGVMTEFEALDDIQEQGRHDMLKFFYGGYHKMSAETYKQKAPEIHELSNSREVNIRSMVATVQRRALHHCHQREEAGRDLPASQIVIFVLPGILHEGPRVAELIKEHQKELSGWKKKGYSLHWMFCCFSLDREAGESMRALDTTKHAEQDNVDTVYLDPRLVERGIPPELLSKILLAGTDRKFDDKPSNASSYYSSPGRAIGDSQRLFFQAHPRRQTEQKALSSSLTGPPAYEN
ncbi:hypothetical protein LTR24_010502 [Lithohypha guttulata]|uniref:Uncharacterized protein n=1 Tax=Lithohypha guttulata TaxID=1690604 RepID=A0ABR0JVI8_9EURO|nr:hypothetical protein LTR24_010502 [Lithohypha guttulata]